MSARVKFGADTTEFSRGIDRMQNQVKGLAGRLSSSMKAGLGGLVAGLAANFSFDAIKKSFEEFDRIAKLATQLNDTTTGVQQLALASQLAGADIEMLGKTFVNATTRVREYQAGLKTIEGEDSSKIGRALKELKISADEFTKAGTKDQVLMVAEGMSKMKNSTEANAAAIDLLGNRAKELIPMLSDLNGMKDAFASTPLLSESQIKRIEQFNDSMEKLSAKAKAFAAEIGLGILSFGDTWSWAAQQSLEFFTGAQARSDKLLQRTREINATLAERKEIEDKQKRDDEQLNVEVNKVEQERISANQKIAEINTKNNFDRLTTEEKINELQTKMLDQRVNAQYAEAAKTYEQLESLKNEQAKIASDLIKEEEQQRESALQTLSDMEEQMVMKRLSHEEQIAALRTKAIEQAAKGDFMGAAKTAQALQSKFEQGSIGGSNYIGVITDSLRRVGGGGVAVSGTLEINRGILNENRAMKQVLLDIRNKIGTTSDRGGTFK